MATNGWKTGGVCKIAVLGMLECGGSCARWSHPTFAGNVQGAIRVHVGIGSGLYTDEHPAFTGLNKDYLHLRVNYSAGEYVRSYIIHTNGIEGVWALFKRQIIDTHHYLSSKHISCYPAEMTWRSGQFENVEGLGYRPRDSRLWNTDLPVLHSFTVRRHFERDRSHEYIGPIKIPVNYATRELRDTNGSALEGWVCQHRYLI